MTDGKGTFRFKKVMVIDDTYMDRFLAEKVIKKYSFAEHIVICSSAPDALSYLISVENTPEELPQLIFLDIRMPEMDGFDFLDRFMRLPEAVKEKCQVVMLSSSTNPEDRERSLSNPHVRLFLHKPLTEEKLRKAL